jgi:FeS assembly SUF system regulator
MMKVNRLTDYATLIICEMIAEKNNIVSAKYLSEKTKLGEATVVKLLKLLINAGLLKSYRGNAGGYKLEKHESEITVLDVINAVEGEVAMTLCGMSAHNLCEYNKACRVKYGWNKLNKLFLQVLGSATMKDFMENNINFELTKIS